MLKAYYPIFFVIYVIFSSWCSQRFLDLVTFEGVLTRAYHEHESKADVTKQQPTNSIHSRVSKNPNGRRVKTSKRSFAPMNEPQFGEFIQNTFLALRPVLYACTGC